jgi:hypothetical protein
MDLDYLKRLRAQQAATIATAQAALFSDDSSESDDSVPAPRSSGGGGSEKSSKSKRNTGKTSQTSLQRKPAAAGRPRGLAAATKALGDPKTGWSTASAVKAVQDYGVSIEDAAKAAVIEKASLVAAVRRTREKAKLTGRSSAFAVRPPFLSLCVFPPRADLPLTESAPGTRIGKSSAPTTAPTVFGLLPQAEAHPITCMCLVALQESLMKIWLPQPPKCRGRICRPR